MKVYIKNMVSMRCIILVKDEISRLSLHYVSVELGIADIIEEISIPEHDLFKEALSKSGLELMENKRAFLVEQVKKVIRELIRYEEEPPAHKFSVLLSKRLGHGYAYLAGIFSEVQGTTIEKFMLASKIEYVKELLENPKITLTEIAYKMHYNSVSHLSAQFKKITGHCPTDYSRLNEGTIFIRQQL